MSGSDRWLRLLLTAYPKRFRDQHGDDMVTALVSARADRSSRSTAPSLELVRSGLAERVGLATGGEVAAGFRLAGSVSLALLTAWCVLALFGIELWVDYRPWSPWAAGLWAALLVSCVGQGLLGRRGFAWAWALGVLATGAGFLQAALVQAWAGNTLAPALTSRTVLLGAAGFMALSWFARPETPRARTGAAVIGGAVGALALLRLRNVSNGWLPFRRWTELNMPDAMLHRNLGNYGLIPQLRWSWAGALIVAAVAGWFRPRIGVAAAALALPTATIVVTLAPTYDPPLTLLPLAASALVAIAAIALISVKATLESRHNTSRVDASR